MSSTTEVAVQTPDRLIALAIEKDADVEKLERLFDLQSRWQADNARREFFASLAGFQSTCPEIKRTKKAGNFKYAPLDSILKQLSGHPEKFGFSFRFNEDANPDGVTVQCILTHTAGHSETNTCFVPLYVGQGKTNVAQDSGGASTYGRRRSLSNALGLVVDDDDDGASAGPDHVQRCIAQMSVLRANWELIGEILDFFSTGATTLEQAALAYATLTKDDLMAVNLAPSYGGLFDTQERAFLKSDKSLHELVTKYRNDAGWHQKPENQL